MLRPSRTNRGSSLVLALLFTTVIALAVSALLSFTNTGVLTTQRLAQHTSDTYAADGATQVAVNTLRNSTFNNTSGQTCLSGTLLLSSFTSTSSAAVTCTPIAGTGGLAASVPTNTSNRPNAALMTLGTSPLETGLSVKNLSPSNAVQVHGDLGSNSTIVTQNGPVVVSGSATAHGSCSSSGKGSITANPLSCNSPTIFSDPGYALPALPAYQPLPACTSSSVVTFSPGYYDDAAALSSMMSKSSSCSGSTWYFKPGVYYFDFHNQENPALTSSGSDVWTVASGALIGGTLSSPLVPGTTPSTPGACISPLTSTSAPGVEFVFGGDSRISLGDVPAEICGTYSASAPPLTLVGVRSGSASPTSTTLSASSVANPGGFTNPSNAFLPDGNSATWTTSTFNRTTTVLGLGGFATSIPAGSIVTSASIHLVRFNNNPICPDTYSVTLTPSGGPSFSVPVPTVDIPTLHSEDVDFTNQTAFTKYVHDHGLSALDASFSASVTHPGTESLDALQINLTYTPPAFRSEATTITALPSCTAQVNGCSLLTTGNSPHLQLYIQGTLYAPLASASISLNNQAGSAFTDAVILRSLSLSLTGSTSITAPLVTIPDPSLGYAPNTTAVYLTTYLCAGGNPSACLSTSPALRARIRLHDASSTPVAGARQVTVESWSATQ